MALDKTPAPNLPLAPPTYAANYVDQLNNVLRLFFNRFLATFNTTLDTVDTIDARTTLISSGTGSPESVVTGAVGSLYLRTDGGASTTLYIKESGTGNTGWAAK